MEQVLLLDKLMNESPTTSELTPRSQLGMKVSNSLSGSQMREVGRFLKQKTRQSVFCSIEKEEKCSNTFKPRSTSFKLIDRKSGIMVKEYIAPELPIKTANMSKEDFRKKKKEYVAKINPPLFSDKFSKLPEMIQPHMVIYFLRKS